MARSGNPYAGSTVLITGGTGSIGIELATKLLELGPREIRLFSNDENGLFEARGRFVDHPEVAFKMGDVRDTHSIESVIGGCDFVFHAAALKHVHFCESNPYEAISTNILGTQNVIDSALKYKVDRFVFISTDKAVSPASTMGATKLLGEKLVVSASKFGSKPIFSVVRFGNVLGSRGSAVLIFEREVKEGRAITVTNPDMTRFIMNPGEAARLVLKAAASAKTGEAYVLKMKAARIGDLAEACREFFSEMRHENRRPIPIKVVGAQEGEKLHEELMTEQEAAAARRIGNFYIISPVKPQAKGKRIRSKLGGAYSSNSTRMLSRREIVQELAKLY